MIDQEDLLRRLQALKMGNTVATPDVQAPPPPESQYYVRANELEQQAAQPQPKPQGFQQNAVNALQHFGDAFTNPHGYQQMDLQKQEFQRQKQQDLLSQAKSLRGQGQFQDQQNRLIDATQSERDLQNRRLNVDEQRYQAQQANEERRYNDAKALSERPKPFGGYAPGDIYGMQNPITGERTIQGSVPGKTNTEKSLQPMQVEFTNGKNGMVNFNPGEGKYHDPTSGADITSSVKGKYEKPPSPQFAVISSVDDAGDKITKIVPKAASEYKGAPTAQELNRRDQAIKVSNYADHVLQLIDKSPNVVGPILGRIAKGEKSIGTISPEGQALGSALGSLIALQPILHGFRGGSQTMDHFNAIIGDQHLNAAALKAGINEIKVLAEQIKQHPVEQDLSSGSAATHRFNPATGKIEAIK